MTELIKENRSWNGREPLSLRWVVAGLTTMMFGLALVGYMDRTLPAPQPQSPATVFNGYRASEFLNNLTAIGPRVAGSYENEVAAVNTLVVAVKNIAVHASPHNHVELDLHRASGAFPLKFFDGMNNIYRNVQSVVVRVRGAGGGARGKRTALLLNCHFDTVPDSPGASDDGAACAVLIEVLRALAATPHPLKHDAIFLFNGAEENIMQASHAFITTHKWAKSIRAFINIEACGAGGREVLFQAGPHDPWIMEVYSGAVPHPYGSSLAQELFESGLVPADTDFRIFRDFGKLSGVDLAWTTNGYVYHTHKDTTDNVPSEVLQRSGDNVLALTHGLLSSENIETDLDPSSRQPVFFDVLGLWLVCFRAPLAAAVAMATLLLATHMLHADAVQASQQLYVTKSAWWRSIGHCLLVLACAHLLGLGAAASMGLISHGLNARLPFYSSPWLLGPLYAAPALAAAWWTLRVWVRRATCGAVPVRGWWAARLVSDAVMAGWSLLLLACSFWRLRSGFVPGHWALLLALSSLVSRSHGEGGRLVWWAIASLLPLLQTWYLMLAILQMFVPIMGRAGTPPLPPDVILGLLTGVFALGASAWLLPAVVASRGTSRLIAFTAVILGLLTGVFALGASTWLLPAVAAARGTSRLIAAALFTAAFTAALVVFTPLGFPYTEDKPQRCMVFHTRRTIHTSAGLQHEDIYWTPHLDANTPRAVKDYVPEVASAQFIKRDCDLWPYCGVPYPLPVGDLVARGYTLPAPAPPAVDLAVVAKSETVSKTRQAVHLDLTGPTHIVLIISPVEGANISWCSALNAAPQEAVRWKSRHTYFLSLFDSLASSKSSGSDRWNLTFHIDHSFSNPPEYWTTISVAGHAMAAKRADVHEELFRRFPKWTAPTGWGVHLHLLNV